MSTLTVYAYAKCGTCKKALKWLQDRSIEHEVIPIVDNPPNADELARIQALASAPVKKLFNTSGQSYRQGGWKDRMAAMSDREAHEALAADGKLIKRPLVVGEDFALIGFSEADYAAKL